MINKLKPKSEFSRNVLTLMTGTTIAQAIPIAISPILTRIYTPEDFGIFALFIAITGLFSVIASGRYEMALMMPKKEEDAINILALGVLIILGITVSLWLGIFIFHTLLLDIVGGSEIGVWFFFIPVVVFFTGLFNLLTYYHTRQQHYKDIARASVVKSIVLSVVQIIVGLMKPGVSGLISGQIVAQTISNAGLVKLLFDRKDLLHDTNKVKMISLAKKYKDFPKFQAPHTMLNTFSMNIPVYMFSLLFSSSVVGFYALSTRMVFSPFMIITSSVGKIYTQKVSARYHQGLDGYSMTVALLRSLFIKLLIPFILIIFFAPEIFSLLFGAAWREAGYYTQLLSLWLFLNILVSTVSFIPSLINKQKKALLVSIVQVALLVFSIGLGSYFGEVYLSLFLFSLSNSMILIYNLSWMLNGLKENEKFYGDTV